MIEDEDIELVNKFKQGEQSAFLGLVEKYQEKVYSLAFSFTHNASDAEEVAQDAFLSVARKINSFLGTATFSSWLYRITSNAALMKLRTRRREKYILIEDTVGSEGSSQTNDIEDEREDQLKRILSDELREQMIKAVNKLSETDRQIFYYKDINGLSNEEIASIMSLTLSAVKARLHRTRITLQRAIAKYLKEEI